MGNTAIRYMPLGKGGQVFFESFEADNWLTNEGWGTLNGTPVNSGVQFKFGTKSFKMDSSFPLIQKDFSSSPNLGANCYFKVWFYDQNSMLATSPVYAFFIDSAGRSYGIGIDDSATIGNYKFNNNGLVSSTGRARSLGWHCLTFKYTFNSSLVMTIDNNQSLNIPVSDSRIFRKIKLGTTATSGVTPVGYFDYAQVASDWKLNLYGLAVGQKALLLSDLNNPFTPLASATSVSAADSGTVLTMDLSNGLLFDCPITGYLMVTGTDGIAPYYFSEQRSIFFGDSYVLRNMDFGRRATTFGKPRGIDRTNNISTSGKEENILFSSREPAKFNIQDITDDQRRALLSWWSAAQAGQVTAICMDSAQVFVGPLSTAAAAGSLTVKFNTFYSRQIEKGATFLLYGASGLTLEECKVSSVNQTTGVVTLTSPLVYSYPIGAFARSVNFWPWALCQDKAFPISLSSPKVKRWNFMPNFIEAF